MNKLSSLFCFSVGADNFYLVFALWLHIFSVVFLFTDGGGIVLQIVILLLLPMAGYLAALKKINIPSRIPVMFFFVFSCFFSVLSLYYLQFTVIIKLFNLMFVVLFFYFVASVRSDWFEAIAEKYALIGSFLLLFFILRYKGVEFRGDIDMQPNYIGMVALTIVLAAYLSRLSVSFRVAIYLLALTLALIISSRSSLLMLFLIIFWDFVFYKKENRFFRAFSGIFFSCVFLLSNADVVSSILMLEDQYRGVGTGFSGRGARWELAINYWLEKPVLGYGYGLSTEVLGVTVDNAYLSILLDCGLIGLIIYLFFNFTLVYHARFNCKLVLYLLAFLIYGVFEKRYWNVGNGFSLFYYLVVFKVLEPRREFK